MKLSECEQQQQDGDDNGGHLFIQSSTPGKHSHIRSMWAPSIIVINTESTSPCSPGGSVMMTVFLPVHVSTMKQKEWQLKKAEIREATGRCIFTLLLPQQTCRRTRIRRNFNDVFTGLNFHWPHDASQLLSSPGNPSLAVTGHRAGISGQIGPIHRSEISSFLEF